MILAYLPVCPWEAVAVGKIASYIFPALNSMELYRLAGKPVYLPHVVIGLALTFTITALNFRGIRVTASFHNWMTYGLLALTLVFVSRGLARGSLQNFAPLFSRTGWVSVLLVLQVVPFFMTGFESVGKCAEEASPEFRSRGFFRAILLALVVGVIFYAAVISAVACVHPWQALTRERFGGAVVSVASIGGKTLRSSCSGFMWRLRESRRSPHRTTAARAFSWSRTSPPLGCALSPRAGLWM